MPYGAEPKRSAHGEAVLGGRARLKEYGVVTATDLVDAQEMPPGRGSDLVVELEQRHPVGPEPGEAFLQRAADLAFQIALCRGVNPDFG